jgi:hypothetical protein
MNIPNLDGKYKTRDGSLIVTVTRSNIIIDVKKPKDEFIVIDDDDDTRGSREHKKQTSTPLQKKFEKIGDGLSGITYALTGKRD